MLAIASLTLRERRRQLFWTVLGMLLLVGMVVGIWPSYRDADIGSIYGELPESMQSMFGLAGDEFTGATFVHAELMSLMVPIVLVGIAITIGAGSITNEVAAGRMDVLLATGITRQRLVLGRAIGMTLQLLMISACSAIALIGGGAVVDLGLDTSKALGAMLLAWELGVLYGALALALASWFGRHGVAAGIAAAVAITSWLVSSLGAVVESLEPVSRVLAFHMYTAGPPLIVGPDVSNVLLLAGEIVVLVGVAVLGFTRRDVQ